MSAAMNNASKPVAGDEPVKASTMHGVVREPTYFGDSTAPLFGWYHHAQQVPPRDCVAVICSPIGPEYGPCHRTVRHLADALAESGIAALRFDYHGVGDSTGSDLDAGRVAAWKASIQQAIDFARAQSGREHVCLVGIGLGATLAASVAAEVATELLVMWNPWATGKGFLRQQRAMSLAISQHDNLAEVALESAGCVYTQETIAALEALDLRQLRFGVGRRALLVQRDDKPADDSLSLHFAAIGIAHDLAVLPGYAAMTREPQFTEVPLVALRSVVEWVVAHSVRVEAAASSLSGERRGSIVFQQGDGGDGKPFEEIACRFGERNRLFGILSRPLAETGAPVVVMFNAGSNHHVGGFQLYVKLARRLAAQGFPVLRFDIGGIGDSVLPAGERENHPYPPHALTDATQAFDYLRRQFGYRRIVPLGHCSGAHAGFHAGLNIVSHELVELIQINPLAFYWEEGMGLETAGQEQFVAVSYYGQSARSLAKWSKLLRGDVDFANLLRVGLNHANTVLVSHLQGLREIVPFGRRTRLATDLDKLTAMGRHIAFFIAEGDAGNLILKFQAGRAMARGIKSGAIVLHSIPGSDHTFSRLAWRNDLAEKIAAHLRARYPEASNH